MKPAPISRNSIRNRLADLEASSPPPESIDWDEIRRRDREAARAICRSFGVSYDDPETPRDLSPAERIQAEADLAFIKGIASAYRP